MSEAAVHRAASSPTGWKADAGDFEVPEGKRLEWTESGQPYLEATNPDEESDEAANEHKRVKLKLNVTFDELEERFGIGTRIYWHFLIFIIVTNFTLGLVNASNYIFYVSTRSCENGCGPLGSSDIGAIHEAWCFQKSGSWLIKPGTHNASAPACQAGASTYDAVACADTSSQKVIPAHLRPALTRKNPFSDPSYKLNELFIAQYNEKHRWFWTATLAIAVLLTHLFGPCFFLYVRHKINNGDFRSKNKDSPDHDNPFTFGGLENARIPGNDRVRAVERTLRMLASYTVFGTLVAISFGIVFGLEWWNKEDLEKGGATIPLISFRWLDLMVTLTITLINMFFSQISSRLTRLEKHVLWATHRRHHTLKLYSFKILNVTSMYLAIGAVPIRSACPYNDTGRKFLLLMATDLFVQNGLEMFMPLFRTKCLARYVKALRGKGSDEDARPNFDVAEEYLELFYRQYVVYLGMSLFPLLPLVAAGVNVVEYGLDKFRMTKICQKPKRLDLTMKKFLAILLFTTAVLALAMPPIGTGWVLAGAAPFNAAPDACPVFGSFRADRQPIASQCSALLRTVCDCSSPGRDVDCGRFGPGLVGMARPGNVTFYPPPLNANASSLAEICAALEQ